MYTISDENHQKLEARLSGLKAERDLWASTWQELADYYLPRRYVWLDSSSARPSRSIRNPLILDGTGTIAARILAAGMMNGITSPARPWFRLRISGFEDDLNSAERIWLDEVQRRMLLVLAESNFYNAIAVLYLDLVIFGTAAMIMYEDHETVIRCYNPALGEYFVGQSPRLEVNAFGREFTYRVGQLVQMFGKENLSDSSRSLAEQGGSGLSKEVKVTHLIQPNLGDGYTKKHFGFTECYWETGAPKGKLLRETGFYEFPAIVARWELTANDSYGSSPAMDALGDVKQLQQETMEKGKSLSLMNTPPMLADIQLQHKPSAFMPRGITYVAGLTNGAVGAKPAWEVNPPIAAMTMDLQDIRGRIREFFNNDLFQMISQLDTVRTATEIDARREEKLIRLGSVLERFENECLNPSIKRLFAIMQRAGLLPDAPDRMGGADLEIQYSSILTTAQSAVGAAPTERFLQLVGGVATLYPKALNIPNFDDLIRDYARDVGVPSKNILPKEVTQAMNSQQDSLAAAREATSTGAVLADGAKTLSETDVGGGANALQRLLG